MPATLLLADDSVTIQRVIELTFASEDIRVVTAGDGEAAMQRIDAEIPDIVLADVGMPKCDGYELAEHIKRTPTLKHIPVLLLTGAFEPVDEDRARASGCDGILVKPFEPQQLVSRVKELLAGKRETTLLPERVVEPVRPVEPIGAVESARPTPLAPLAPPSSEAATLKPVEPEHPDWEFQQEMAQLDAAFAELDTPSATSLDAATESDFARDLHLFRSSGEPSSEAGAFGDWDLPKPPVPSEMPASVPAPSAESSAWDLDAAAELAEARRIVEETPAPSEPRAAAALDRTVDQDTAAMPSKVPLAGAFAALLAAEQSQPAHAPRPPSPALSESAVEEVVRRVLARMTDQTVRQVVLETAERLIREEIEKIRANP